MVPAQARRARRPVRCRPFPPCAQRRASVLDRRVHRWQRQPARCRNVGRFDGGDRGRLHRGACRRVRAHRLHARAARRGALIPVRHRFWKLRIRWAILGNEALLYVAISLIPANIAMFGIGPALFSQGTDEGNNGAGSLAARSAPSPARRLRTMLASLKTPTFFASLLVLVLALLGITSVSRAIRSASSGRPPRRSRCS